MKSKPKRRPGNPALPRNRHTTRWLWIVAIGAAILALWWTRSDRGPAETIAAGLFAPTIEDPQTPPGPSPAGMVWIPGGEFSMGAQDPPGMNDTVGMQATKDSRPVHRVFVDGFWMDATEVTNEQFERVRQGDRLCNRRREDAARGGFSRRAAGKPRRRLGDLFTAAERRCRSTITFSGGRTRRARAGVIRSAPAASIDRQGELSRRAHRLRRRRRLREVGGQAAADRSRVGIRGARRTAAAGLSVGRRLQARRKVDGQQPSGTLSRSRHRRRRARRHRARRAVSS